ncbi:MAG: serine/threonine protein kinase, partial [Bdellovibrionales bacterium]|nr:serine/threonine protein kinase [Oligoflexia bacterium]
MSESVLKKFGKYFLLDRIGEGGMAEIFRARMSSLNETGRLIVIKRIQGAYSNNPEFLQMFKAEVQVTMRFTHPNIVQLYESGEEAGQQFIAMELVDGRNLRQVLSKVSQRQQRIPVSASCFIVEQTAAGLHYAHTFKDRITGEAINLVHRDVSPQNILVSYDGNIKVIDFGIAKAANGEATRAGVIKGKLSYLAPEQVMGEVLDARSDVFALGIVLWELLTGKRLFVAEGDNEFQVLKMIESCNTFVKPPSTINPEVSKDLDAIVMQALCRDVKKRFQSAEEVAKALRKLLAVEYSDFGPSDLASFTKKLFH